MVTLLCFSRRLSIPNLFMFVFVISDPANKDYIIGNGGIQNLKQRLNTDNDDILLSCITTLMFLYSPIIRTGK